MMLTAEAVIRTEHADRYLSRLREHSGKMSRHSGHWKRRRQAGHVPPEVQDADWSDLGGTVTLNWGRWTARAGEDVITLRAEAADPESLQRITSMLTTRLQAYGSREQLAVTWQPAGPSATGAHPNG
jgi:hypothetical protein